MPAYRLEDLKVGQAEEVRIPLSIADVDAFAALSGDRAPLHMDASFALVSRFIGMHLPGDHGILRKIEMDFRRPVTPPCELTVRGEVTQISEAVGQVTLQIRVTREDGELVSTARVQSVVRA
jgi:acyl dehydratase